MPRKHYGSGTLAYSSVFCVLTACRELLHKSPVASDEEERISDLDEIEEVMEQYSRNEPEV